MKQSQRTAAHNILLSCGITGSLIFTLLYIIEANLAPGYSSIRQAISDLELVDNGWMQSANFIIMGIFVSLFAVGLRKELERGTAAYSLPVFQFFVALGLIFSGVFIHDPLHKLFPVRQEIQWRSPLERLGSLFYIQWNTYDGLSGLVWNIKR
jgi:hypothetical membrane protein